MAKINSLNNVVYFLFFCRFFLDVVDIQSTDDITCRSVLHLATASKPSIKMVTVNPCSLSPTIPTYISPSSPCPTITISTSHTSCHHSGFAYPNHLQTTPTSCSQNFCISDAFITVPCTCPYSVPTTTSTLYPHVPPPVRKLVTSDIKSTKKHAVPPHSTLQLLSPSHGWPNTLFCPSILPTQFIAFRPVHITPSITTQPLISSPAPVPIIPYPTNCIFPCPIHTATTITPTPNCESITLTKGVSCLLIVGVRVRVLMREFSFLFLVFSFGFLELEWELGKGSRE
ncbi:hypothetical protein EAF00_004283 [Botryotinia globosa]|nr:hypothetical protein EAF00_004283 [Botryotinia globosa]